MTEVRVLFRPFRHLCPEANARDQMSDGEFWDHVFSRFTGDHGYQEVPDPLPSWQDQPCPECGEWGACGYDDSGRPLVHIPEGE